MRVSLFSSLKKGSTCAFHASLLSSSLKQQETPRFEVLQRPLCAITFQLQPFFPWNCASLEQKKCPAIQNIRCQAKKMAIFANFVFFKCICYLMFCFISPSTDITLTWLIQVTPHLYIYIYLSHVLKIKYTTYKMIWMSRHNIVVIFSITMIIW
jgi:hypothetical protein